MCGTAFMILLAVIFSPTDKAEARMTCEMFEEIYGDYFEAEDRDCLFEYNDLSLTVEWDEIENHKTVLFVLGTE